MTNNDPQVETLVGQAWTRPVPEGLVRHWTDDGQGGGWLEYVTPEEADRRDAELEAEEKRLRKIQKDQYNARSNFLKKS